MHAMTQRLRTGVLRAATMIGVGVRSVPGTAGALLIAGGVYEAYRPAGLITAGLFLLLLDRSL